MPRGKKRRPRPPYRGTATMAQIGYLKGLVGQYGQQLPIDWYNLSREDASRWIDWIKSRLRRGRVGGPTPALRG